MTNISSTPSGLASAAKDYTSNLAAQSTPPPISVGVGVLVQPAGFTAGSPQTSSVGVIAPTTQQSDTDSTSPISMFEFTDPNPDLDTKSPGSSISNSTSNNVGLVTNFSGALQIAPDLLHQAQTSFAGSIQLPSVSTGLSSASSSSLTAIANGPSLLSGNGTALAATGNFNLSIGSASLLGTPKTATITASDKLASLFPNIKVPGTPSLATVNTNALNASLASSTPSLQDAASKAASTLSGATLPSGSSPPSASALKSAATTIFTKIQNIAKGISLTSPSLGSVTSLGGAISMPGSASSITQVANVASSQVPGLGGTALQALSATVNSPASNPLSGISNTTKSLIAFTPPAISLSQASSAVNTAVSASTAQTATLIKTLPGNQKALSSLPTATISALKEKLAVASLSGSGFVSNVAAGSISVDVGSVISGVGLSLGSVTGGLTTGNAAAKATASITSAIGG